MFNLKGIWMVLAGDMYGVKIWSQGVFLLGSRTDLHSRMYLN